MIALLSAVVAVPLSPRERRQQEVIVYESADAPGPLIVRMGEEPKPESSLSTDAFSIEAEEAMRQAEADIKAQTEAMKADTDKVKESEDEIKALYPSENDSVAAPEEQASSSQEEATSPEDATEATGVQAPAPESTAVQAPAPESTAVQAPAPESTAVQAPAPEAVAEQAPAPEAVAEQAPAPVPSPAASSAEDSQDAQEDEQATHADMVHGFTQQAESLTRDAEAAMTRDAEAIKDQMEAVKTAEAKAKEREDALTKGLDPLEQEGSEAAEREQENAQATQEEASAPEDEDAAPEEADAADAADATAAAPVPLGVQAPAPDPVAVAPENDAVQAPAPEPIAVAPDNNAEQAPAPESITSAEDLEKAQKEAEAALQDLTDGAQEKQRKLEEDQETLEKAEKKERKAAEKARIEAEKQEHDKMAKEVEEERKRAEEEKERALDEANDTAEAFKEDEERRAREAEEEVAAERKAEHDEEDAELGVGKKKRPAVERTGLASHWADANALSKLFLHGVPSNKAQKVGLNVHCFDDTENWGQRWMPDMGPNGKPKRKWWSTSIINVHQRSTFGRSGIILSPDQSNEMLCGYSADMGTMDRGCKIAKWRYMPGRLHDLMTASTNCECGYNEVLMDTQKYVDNLPRSVAAFVYGLRGNDAIEFNAGGIAGVYHAFLNFYNLTTADVPLLRVEYDVPFDRYAPDLFSNSSWGDGKVFTDMSDYAMKLWKLEQKHPVKEKPKWKGPGHAYREGARKFTFKQIEEVDRRLQRRLNAEKLDRAREDERLGGRPFDDL